jgi:hypothetical protein
MLAVAQPPSRRTSSYWLSATVYLIQRFAQAEILEFYPARAHERLARALSFMSSYMSYIFMYIFPALCKPFFFLSQLE